MEDRTPVTSAANRFEADMVCGLLRTAGLKCGIDTGASDSAFAGVLAGQITIVVHAADLDAARTILAGADPG
jgi:Putative prokaryotic signal transducing protein